MNFLAIVQRLRQECAIAGTGPSAVTSQTGELKRLVDWVATSWLEIQNLHDDWDWMRGTFSFTTTPNDDAYSASDVGISTRFGYWDRNMVRVYATSVSDETELIYLPYEDWRVRYRVGTNTPSRPVNWSIHPDRSLLLGYKPDAAYTVSGEYGKTVQELTADADIPECPTQYHMVIVYRAMMKYARYSAAPEIYEDAKIEYLSYLRKMESRHLPEILESEPLA
jgi:hypothetical protein